MKPAGIIEVNSELRQILQEILDSRFSEQDWANHESDDWFQTDHFIGGFDADSRLFGFSHYGPDGSEVWFFFSLAEVPDLLDAENGSIPCFLPDI